MTPFSFSPSSASELLSSSAGSVGGGVVAGFEVTPGSGQRGCSRWMVYLGAAGVMLLLFRPFKVGDLVEVGGQLGVIQAIGIFTTTINSLDNKRVIQPNSQVFSGTIINYNGNDTRRVDMVFGISYDDDIRKAKEVLEQIIAADERILAEPAPVIALGALAGTQRVDLKQALDSEQQLANGQAG